MTKPDATPPNGQRVALPVRMLKFVSPQDGPGLQVASACTATSEKHRQSRHTIEFLPWLRAFRVTYTPPEGQILTGYIPEGRVAYWEPLD